MNFMSSYTLGVNRKTGQTTTYTRAHEGTTMRCNICISANHMWRVSWSPGLHFTVRTVANDCDVLITFTFYLPHIVIERKVLRRIQQVSGIYGMVAPCEKTCLLHPVVGTFQRGDTLRVVQPAEVVCQVPWVLEDNKSCGLKMTYDLPRDKSLGTLTVRVCWRTMTYSDERNFVKTHFKYWCVNVIMHNILNLL